MSRVSASLYVGRGGADSRCGIHLRDGFCMWKRVLRHLNPEMLVLMENDPGNDDRLGRLVFDRWSDVNFIEYWPRLRQVKFVGSTVVYFREPGKGLRLAIRPWVDEGQRLDVFVRRVYPSKAVTKETIREEQVITLTRVGRWLPVEWEKEQLWMVARGKVPDVRGGTGGGG